MIRPHEICAAPFIPEAVPLEEETLRPLIEKFPERFDLYLALGNLLFREGEYSGAIQTFNRALILEPNSAETLCNLGIAYGLLGRLPRALACLRRAGLVRPDLLLCQLALARFALQRGDEELARAAFLRVLEYDAQHEESLVALGRLCELVGESSQAQEYYQRAIANGKVSRISSNRLAHFAFQEGQRLFAAGDLDGAFSAWSKTYRQFPESFVDELDIVRAMRSLIFEFGATKQLDEALKEFNVSNASSTDYHDIVIKYLFTIGLIPELYVTREEIASETVRWKESLVKEGDHGYPHYRLALLLALEGQLEKSIEELRRTQDLLKGKKIQQLHLPEILEFLNSLQQRLRMAAGQSHVSVGDEEWVNAGFTKKLELRLWKRAGLAPVAAVAWRAAGFTPSEAKLWHREQLEPESARIWKERGFRDAKEIRLWLKGGFDVETATRWKREFPLPTPLALQCHTLGFSDPKEAFEWMQIFQFPGEAFSWREQGLSPRLARLWLEQGISDPFEARARTDDIRRTRKEPDEE